jgi:hypothetical protein
MVICFMSKPENQPAAGSPKACNVRTRESLNVNVNKNAIRNPDKRRNIYIGIAFAVFAPIAVIMFIYVTPIGVSFTQADLAASVTFSLIGLFVGIGIAIILGSVLVFQWQKKRTCK